VEPVSTRCPSVFPTLRGKFVLVIGAVVHASCCGKGGGLCSDLLGVVFLGDVTVLDGACLGRGNKNWRLR
jgi:hypothetical protein